MLVYPNFQNCAPPWKARHMFMFKRIADLKEKCNVDLVLSVCFYFLPMKWMLMCIKKSALSFLRNMVLKNPNSNNATSWCLTWLPPKLLQSMTACLVSASTSVIKIWCVLIYSNWFTNLFTCQPDLRKEEVKLLMEEAIKLDKLDQFLNIIQKGVFWFWRRR